MMMPVWTAPDLLEVVCRHVDTVQHLGMLSSTNRLLRDYLFSYPGGRHWLDAGELLCGAAYWPTVDWNLPHADDGRYMTMLRVCPWLSAPCHFKIDAIRGYMALGAGRCVVRGLNVVGGRCLLLTSFHGLGSVFGGNHSRGVVSTFARGDDDGFRPDCAVYPPDKMDFVRFTHSIREAELMAEYRCWRPRTIFQTEVQSVRIVHEGLLCVVCCCPVSMRGPAEIYFVSAKTRRVLHEMSIPDASRFVVRNLVVKAGEMWLVDRDDLGTFSYFGPRVDRQLATTGHGLSSAFWAAFRGEMGLAIEIIDARRVDPVRVRWTIGDVCQFAIRGGWPLDALLKRWPGFADYDSLRHAVTRGSAQAVRTLVQARADPSAFQSEILHHAAACARTTVQMVRLLMDSGASLETAERIRPVLCSLGSGAMPQVLRCLACGGAARQGVLSRWVLRGHEMAELIRELDGPVDEANERGETPLMHAAASLLTNNVRALLECKARVDIEDARGRKAIDWMEAALEDPVPEWCVFAAHTAYRQFIFNHLSPTLRDRHVDAMRDLL